MAAFIRGQGTVCLVLGTFYAIALMVAGLQFGLVVGFVAGMISFIPYVGALFGGLMALGLALFQYWGAIEVAGGSYATDWTRIAIIGAIFAVGQVLEGNILTPKLVGDSVGLHPVWLIFALTVFGSIFGFVGLLVAVPLAAMIGVLTRFFGSGIQGGIAVSRREGLIMGGMGMTQLNLDLPHRTAHGRDAYFISTSNTLAVETLDRPDRWPRRKMILEGPTGAGKSHLIDIWCRDHTAQVWTLDRDHLPPNGAYIAVDDIDHIQGERAAEQALFHLHNHVLDTGGALLLARTTAAKFDLPDLTSRIEATAVTRIQPPDDVLLQAVVLKHFMDRQLSPAPAAQAHLLRHMDRSFQAAARVVAALDARSLAQKKPITRTMVAAVLEEMSENA